MSEKRKAFLDEYAAGVQTMDAERAMRATAPGYRWYDGLAPEPITRETFAEYLMDWEDRMKSIGGTGNFELSDVFYADQDEFTLWSGWWKFVDTDVEGSSLVKVGNDGVIYEKIAYFKPTSPK
jgi:hypothetical protein